MESTRRTFVLMATAGVAMAAPSDRIQVGFIGLGGQSTSRLAEFLKQPDVEAVAVCDPDTSHADRAAEIVANAQGRKPGVFHDDRKLLDRKDLDAVDDRDARPLARAARHPRLPGG
jgi:hypothetical protein